MTIVEYVNEIDRTMRIVYVPDGKVSVMRSHGISIAYLLNYQRIKREFPDLDAHSLDQRVKRYLEYYVKR